jgi:hypothetical protein
MGALGARLRRASRRATGQRGVGRPRTRVAVAATTAAFSALWACAAVGPSPEAAAARMRASLDTGLDLYESGEFALAARRFRQAAALAGPLDETEVERKATAGECLCWLRARKLGALAECSERLERLQRKARRSDPAVNTLVALGAVAGRRSLPELRIPGAVRSLIEESAGESR